MIDSSKYKALVTIGTLMGSLFLFSFINSGNDPWEAPEGAKELINRVEQSERSLKQGRAVFNIYCKSCHGKYGKGDGPVSSVLGVSCADLTSNQVQAQTDGEIYYKISVGRVEMPSFKTTIPDVRERWQLVNYIRSLKGVEQVGSY